MNIQTDPATIGLFEPRHVAFLQTITHLRPRLHRYCARMTGSAMDGEDVMQAALFEAYRKLDRFDDGRDSGPGCSGSRTIDASISCADVMSGRRPKRPPRNPTRSSLSARWDDPSTAPSNAWSSIFRPKKERAYY